MTVAAVYVRRTCAGGALVGLRFADLRSSAEWHAPGSARAAEEPIETIKAAARWLAERVKESPGQPELTIVMDGEGTGCQWITAPSGNEAVVRAAVRDAQGHAGDDEPHVSLAWMGEGTPGVDLSVQGLTDVAVLEKTAGSRRLALVAVNDLPVRVLMDELDRLGVQVRRSCSLWHGMVMAWGTAAEPDGGPRDARVVASSEAVEAGAVVLIEPEGRLSWAWAQGGALQAGGTMLLRRSEARLPEPGEEEAGRGTLRLRRETEEPGEGRTVSVVEVTRSDVGRLTADWLSFSVQLGVTPARIACLGPGSVTCSGLEFDLPDMMGVAAVGAGIGKHWPGAAVQATLDDDPIGRMLARLVDIENGASGSAASPAAAVDPRLSVTELSSRPAAADRRLHLWGGLALAMVAAAVAVLGWQVGRKTGAVRAAVAEVQTKRTETLQSVSKLAPKALTDPSPEVVLSAKVLEMTKAREDLKDEDPIMAEAARVLRVLSVVPDVQIQTLQLRSMGLMSRIELSVPMEGEQGPTIREHLAVERSGAAREVKWEGRTIRSANQEKRSFNMAGNFEDAPKDAPKTAPAPAPAPPAPAAAAPDNTKPPVPAAENTKSDTPSPAAPPAPAPATPAPPRKEGVP